MKKIFVGVLCFCLMLLAFPGFVYAHTLKIDKNIGIILHVDPDDAPVATEETKLFVEIEDKNGRFNVTNPENCDCRMTILQGDTVLKTVPVTTAGAYNQLRFTFPRSGVYYVRILGKPNGKGLQFQEFTGDFEYFVKPGKNEGISQISAQNPLQAWAPYIAAAAGSFVVLLFVL